MAKYLLKIKYDGKDFYGWAKQPNIPTVQGELEKLFMKYCNVKNCEVFASGRTDRYVHVLIQYLTLELPIELNKTLIQTACKKINLENNQIKLTYLRRVASNFFILNEVANKTYLYKIKLAYGTRIKSDDYYFYYPYQFNLQLARKTSQLFLGTKNFASFTGKEDYQNYHRTISAITITKYSDVVKIYITGQGFMRFQVRNIVGALLAHNRGNYTDEELEDLFKNPKRGKAHYKVPGSGLYLYNVNLKE